MRVIAGDGCSNLICPDLIDPDLIVLDLIDSELIDSDLIALIASGCVPGFARQCPSGMSERSSQFID
jgi:hypothetical protein